MTHSFVLLPEMIWYARDAFAFSSPIADTFASPDAYYLKQYTQNKSETHLKQLDKGHKHYNIIDQVIHNSPA